MKQAFMLVVLTAALLLGADLVRAQSPARDAGYLYLSPVPGASYVLAQTRYVLVRFENVTPAEVTNLTTSFITVTGANSGLHSGVTHVATDGRTIIFTMSVDFSENELVTVTLSPELAGGGSGTLDPYEYQFMITAPMPGSLPAAGLPSRGPVSTGEPGVDGGPSDGPSEGPKPAGGGALAAAMVMPNGVSVPSDFPTIVVTVNSNPSPGYLFFDNRGQGDQRYYMILDNSGYPVWYSRSGGWNFRVQKNGMITMSAALAYDKNFNYVKTYRMVNGYIADSHDFRLLEDGSYLMIGNRIQTVDMTRYLTNANPSAQVREGAIQEFTAADELIFQWRAWDNYDVLDIQLDDPRMASFSFPHMNAVTVDEDGHLLVSSRNLNEVTKINRDTGDIIWRLGGAHNDFAFTNDPWNGFSCQHDISALGNNRYMVFDNGDLRSPRLSRAVEYQLDLTNLTAAMFWQFRDTPDVYSDFMGNAQRLPNGNTLINWTYSKFVEVDSSGAKHFQVNLVPISQDYRVLRFPWDGVVAVPYLIAEPQADNVALIFNKFGDTNVGYYRIYGGTSPHPTNVLATSTTTLKHLSDLENGRLYYFRVTAVSKQDIESGFSNEENLTVNIIKPGEQMILNGDFSQGTNSWSWAVSGGAAAQWQITNGVSYFDIANGGSTVSSLQLSQPGQPLLQGKKYVFEFDAWAQGPRYIEAEVGQAVSPYANYSGTWSPWLTPVSNHYRSVFTMQAASDFNASVKFNLGGSVLDVHVDNVSLFNTPPGDFNLDGRVDQQDLATLAGEWLKQQPNLVSDLDGTGKVDFKDFQILGENWSGGTP